MASLDSMERFKNSVREAQGSGSDRLETLARVKAAMVDLLGDSSFLGRRYGLPRAGESGTYLLYRDADFGFSVSANVLRPGHVGPPHDHGPGWGVYGIYLRPIGMTQFRVGEEDEGREKARLTKIQHYLLEPGAVDAFLPGEIHQTHNPSDEPAVSLTIYEKNLQDVKMRIFNLKENSFKRGPGGGTWHDLTDR